MASVLQQRLSVQEFLAQEAVAHRKHEYYRGEVFAMAGASTAHNRIVGNILGRLFQQLDGKPCQANSSNVMVKAGELYTYPDCTVACSPTERESAPIEVLLNPKVIVEVLSPSTERYDRNVKFQHYADTPSVEEILLVQQDATLVERYSRRDGAMLRTQLFGLDGFVTLGSIDCRLPMAQIYDGVEFPADPFPFRDSGCPDEIAQPILRILQHGLLRIRANGWANRADECAAEADHLHNLPNLLADYKDQLLHFYWNVERPTAVMRSANSDFVDRRYEEAWKQLSFVMQLRGIPQEPNGLL